ncbi:MAG: hypothetical protein F6Q13_19740, partial [Mycobacterium sp.]
EFARTLTMTDLVTGWTENYSIRRGVPGGDGSDDAAEDFWAPRRAVSGISAPMRRPGRSAAARYRRRRRARRPVPQPTARRVTARRAGRRPR